MAANGSGPARCGRPNHHGGRCLRLSRGASADSTRASFDGRASRFAVRANRSAQNQEVKPVASGLRVRCVLGMSYGTAETFLAAEELVLSKFAHRGVGLAEGANAWHVSRTEGKVPAVRAVSGNHRMSWPRSRTVMSSVGKIRSRCLRPARPRVGSVSAQRDRVGVAVARVRVPLTRPVSSARRVVCILGRPLPRLRGRG